jgi:hypothetical protein
MGQQPTDPAKIPAPPTPERALPAMKATDVGAAPQTTDPTSNIRILRRNVIFMGK